MTDTDITTTHLILDTAAPAAALANHLATARIEPESPFTKRPDDLDRLRLGLNGPRFDNVWAEVQHCRGCFNSWPLMCEIHSDHVVYLDEDFRC